MSDYQNLTDRLANEQTQPTAQPIYGRTEFVLYSGLGLLVAQQVYDKPILNAIINSPMGRQFQDALSINPEQADLYAALGVGILAVAAVHAGIIKIRNRNK